MVISTRRPLFSEIFSALKYSGLASKKKTKETSLKPGFEPMIYCLAAGALSTVPPELLHRNLTKWITYNYHLSAFLAQFRKKRYTDGDYPSPTQ